MGATKEMYTQMQEQEAAEQHPNPAYDELMHKLQNKEISLSYSALKEFGKSPVNFVNYKLQERREKSDSQIFGSLCDCLITEPGRFAELFTVNDTTPSTDNQKGFCRDVLNGMSIEDAFSNNYARGKAEDVYKSLAPYILACQSGKTVVSQQMFDEAKDITENLLKSDLISTYLNACDGFQQRLDWEYGGWKFKGFTDASSDAIIIDLKFTKDADPDKFERDIMNYDYYMQMGMYAQCYEGLPECYFIAYDKSKNFSLIKVDYSLLQYGIRKFQYLVQKFNQCIAEGRFHESYNFFDAHQRTVYKPKWVKGFDTTSDDL